MGISEVRAAQVHVDRPQTDGRTDGRTWRR